MDNPIYEKIEESLGEILSQYVWEINTSITQDEIVERMNNYLNTTYKTKDERYVKEVWEDEEGRIQIELNPNGIIKTRNQKIDEVLNEEI